MTGSRRITVAMFAAAVATMAAMYSTQALLPALAGYFHVRPTMSALTVSLTTGLLAVAIVPAGVLSERFGRTRVMTASAWAAALIGLLLPLCGSLPVLLAARAAQGVALAGVPAVAMAYLAEEVPAASLGGAMGLYVAGTTVGGLIGRLVPALMLEVGSWRWALAAVSVVCAAATGWFARGLPPSRRFVASPTTVRQVGEHLAGHLRDRRLVALYGLGFTLMGGFVSVYSFLGSRLIGAPFRLSQATAGCVFVLYLAGTVTAPAAGRLADRLGTVPVLGVSVLVMAAGVVVTLPGRLGWMVCGVVLVTAGFFGAHTVASGWVGRIAVAHRGEAAALYLFGYYLGSALVVVAAGVAYEHGGWPGLVGSVAALLTVALLLTASLAVPLVPAEFADQHGHDGEQHEADESRAVADGHARPQARACHVGDGQQ